MSNSVLRRYTPPTCTLEIAAKGSPLSRWTDRPVLKQLRFQLSFDDPKLSAEEQVQIRGSRSQLEALCEVVQAYVQNFLAQPPDQLDRLSFIDKATNGSASGSNGFHAVPALVNSGAIGADHPSFQETSDPYAEEEPGAAIAPVPQATGIELKPQGLLAHSLHLGTLATAESGAAIRLSTVQLYDLANALDEYAADALVLPALGRQQTSWLQSPWLRVAAATILAVGVTASLTRFVMDVSSPSMQTATTADSEASPGNQSVAIAPPAGSLAPTTPVTPGTDFAPPAPLKLEPLPPPPPPGTAVPPASGTPTVVVPRTAPNRSTPPSVPTRPLPSIAAVPPPPRTPQQVQIPTQPAPPIAARSAQGDAATNGETALQAPGAATEQQDSASIATNRAAARPDGTAFDTIPQVAEAREYFQERWQPPEGLSQTLEYQLQIGADGSIQRIVPLGQAAGDYVDRTQIPLVGDPFVSPLESQQEADIRLVLSPDGRVRTFLEPSN
jgi:Domain of unknown function (DUF4335)